MEKCKKYISNTSKLKLKKEKRGKKNSVMTARMQITYRLTTTTKGY